MSPTKRLAVVFGTWIGIGLGGLVGGQDESIPAELPSSTEILTESPDCWGEAARSRWYASTDVLWLTRDYSASFPLARTVDRDANTIPGGALALSDVSDNSARPGLRFLVGYAFASGTAIELGYFGLQQWSQSGSIFVQDPPFANSPFLGSSVPFGNKSFDTTLTAKYDSLIHNAEANLRHGWERGSWTASVLGGVRYFHLKETIELTGVELFTREIERTRTEANNNLFGAQLGGAITRYWLDGCFALEVNGKAGIYGNSVNQYTSNGFGPLTGVPGTNVLLAGRGSTDLASLYEGAMTGTAQVTEWLTVRGGYQVFYVQGLALAPDQLALTGSSIRSTNTKPRLPPSPLPAGVGAQLRTDGDLFLHGPFVGLEIRY